MFEQAFEAVGYGVLITDTHIDAPGPTIRFANAAMSELTGYPVEELIGSHPRILQGPDTDRDMLDRLKESLRLGRQFKGDALNYRKDGSSYVVDWTIDPVLSASGEIEAWISVQRDVTRRHKTRVALEESEQRLRVLVAELQHRTRNLMGVVSVIADNTGRASADLPDFRSRFSDRLEALSRVQGLLSRLDEHDRVTFDELIRTEVAAMEGAAERVTLSGAMGVRLRSSTVQTLAMALHELATNAVEHGALKQPDGKLSISWSLRTESDGSNPRLSIDWRETGVVMPVQGSIEAGAGQGRELIEQALPYQLKAETALVFKADGVHCTIVIPVSSSTA